MIAKDSGVFGPEFKSAILVQHIPTIHDKLLHIIKVVNKLQGIKETLKDHTSFLRNFFRSRYFKMGTRLSFPLISRLIFF